MRYNNKTIAMNQIIRRTIFFSFLFLSVLQISFGQGTNEDYLSYIEHFKSTAISEMNRTGIPASIKLAQSLLESNAGKSTLARKAKNHFGIKCGSKWRGKKYHHEDDDYDEYGNKVKSCFRVYKNPSSSFIAHSEFLRDPRKSYRYGPLFSLEPTDYQAWAFGLKESGYATDPRYPQKLIKLIEDYNLAQYDFYSGDPIVITDTDVRPTKNDQIFGHLGKINDLKVFVAKGGESVYQIAFKNNVKLKRLIKYNDAVTSGENRLPKGYKLYLNRKRNSWRGKALFHYVQKGETLFDISQKYGIRMKKLRRKNKLPENTEPLEGERIRLRWWHKRGEVVKYKNTAHPIPMLRSADIDPKSDKPKRNKEGDLLDMEVSPSDEKFEEVLIEVDPALTDNSPEEPEIEEVEEIDLSNIADTTTTDLPTTEETTPSDPVVIDTTPIEEETTSVEIEPTETYITIIKGDTLYSLSRAFGTPVKTIKKMNGLTSNALSIGQRIRVK